MSDFGTGPGNYRRGSENHQGACGRGYDDDYRDTEMAFARDVSDKILFMDDGVVAAQGTSEEIFGSHENTRLQAFLTSFYNNHTETGAV